MPRGTALHRDLALRRRRQQRPAMLHDARRSLVNIRRRSYRPRIRLQLGRKKLRRYACECVPLFAAVLRNHTHAGQPTLAAAISSATLIECVGRLAAVPSQLILGSRAPPVARPLLVDIVGTLLSAYSKMHRSVRVSLPARSHSLKAGCRSLLPLELLAFRSFPL